MLDRDLGGGGGIRPTDRVGAGAHRGSQRDLVDVPRSRTRGGLVADDQHYRGVRLHGFGQGGESVREAGTVGRGRRSETAARAMVGVGSHDRARLVADGGEARGCRSLERIEEVRVAVAHHPEDLPHVAGEIDGDVGGD